MLHFGSIGKLSSCSSENGPTPVSSNGVMGVPGIDLSIDIKTSQCAKG